jgi:uncharacterized protein (TIGR03083 family)
MSVAELYHEGRHVLTSLGVDLTPEQAAAPVPACPEWKVKDVFAHLVGLTADVLSGNLDGVATVPWTSKQVADRADHSLGQILAEWADRGPKFEDALRAIGDQGTERILIDQWSHEQDIRGAVGKLGSRVDPRVAFSVDIGMTGFAGGWPAELPTVEITSDSGRWKLGDAAVTVTLTSSDFELVRAIIGRRSRAQYLALAWTPADEAVVGPVVDRLHAFPFREADLIE